MPVWRYSVRVDEERSAKAVMWDAPISYKKVIDLARLLRGMRLEDAKRLLERVAAGKEPIPVRRYMGKQAHHRGLAARYRWPVGRYPVKAARILLKLLESVSNNAEVKGLDTEKLRIVHIGVHKGRVIKKWMPRAFGRSSPRFRKYSHIEVVVAEEE
ncbi:50S ribosomal protein L22 [Pyrodictium occultum]|uniref:Large ribosomal subunit protein uL22 n=1 Tax=Pyrodictium occultum TaxID=2309 RepID=A0A0V8RWB1_PYROC|nr:50S ribosomal protein L22 [Pyrodictium occultum]KSW12361.1 50S ribosomal protein L22 [Pyrodictium occultum]